MQRISVWLYDGVYPRYCFWQNCQYTHCMTGFILFHSKGCSFETVFLLIALFFSNVSRFFSVWLTYQFVISVINVLFFPCVHSFEPSPLIHAHLFLSFFLSNFLSFFLSNFLSFFLFSLMFLDFFSVWLTYPFVISIINVLFFPCVHSFGPSPLTHAHLFLSFFLSNLLSFFLSFFLSFCP